jgi:hypothetical protein
MTDMETDMPHGGISNDRIPQYQTDYIISWDFSNKDFPCVSVISVEKDKDRPMLISRFLGNSYKKTGVVSLRQLLEYRDAEDRYAKEREVDMDKIRKAFEKSEEGTE